MSCWGWLLGWLLGVVAGGQGGRGADKVCVCVLCRFMDTRVSCLNVHEGCMFEVNAYI